MSVNVAKEVAELRRMSAKQLRQKYAEAFGEETISHNKVWMIKRIVWRLQVFGDSRFSALATTRIPRALRFQPGADSVAFDLDDFAVSRR